MWFAGTRLGEGQSRSRMIRDVKTQITQIKIKQIKTDYEIQYTSLFTAGLFDMCSGACNGWGRHVGSYKKFRSVLKKGTAAIEKIFGPFG